MYVLVYILTTLIRYCSTTGVRCANAVIGEMDDIQLWKHTPEGSSCDNASISAWCLDNDLLGVAPKNNGDFL